MAVQQNKKSPSKRGMHRSHNALVTPGTAIEPTTGEVHLRHHISPTGFYRGRKVLKSSTASRVIRIDQCPAAPEVQPGIVVVRWGALKVAEEPPRPGPVHLCRLGASPTVALP